MGNLNMKFEEVQLVYKNKTKAADRLKVNSPEKAYAVLSSIWDKGLIGLVEEAKLLLLDNQLRLMSTANLSFGGMTSAIVDPRMVFSLALKRRSHKIILAHNHPSGTLSPSRADIGLTKNIAMIGGALNIQLEDHLIITDEGYRSIIDCGYGDLSYD